MEVEKYFINKIAILNEILKRETKEREILQYYISFVFRKN